MKLRLEWALPLTLKDGARENLIYNVDLAKLPASHGIYVMGRRFGGGFEALYVGKANNIRHRVRGQLKNLPLMLHLEKAKLGKRVVLTGRFSARPGQQPTKCLAILERALIRHFLSEGHDLVNIQGSRLSRHEIESTGKHPKHLLPKVMFVDKVKGK